MDKKIANRITLNQTIRSRGFIIHPSYKNLAMHALNQKKRKRVGIHSEELRKKRKEKYNL